MKSLALGFLLVSSAFAASSIHTIAQICPVEDFGVSCNQGAQLGEFSSAASASLQASTYGSFDGSTAGSGNFQSYHGTAQLSLTNYTPNVFTDPGGNFVVFNGMTIGATDNLTVTGHTGSGILSLSYSAISSQNNNGFSLPGGTYAALSAPGFGLGLLIADGNSNLQLDIPFTYGTEFDLYMYFQSGFYLYDADPAYTSNYNYSGLITTDVQLMNARITDTDGNLVTGDSLVSAAGVSYGALSADPTPEPATLGLCMAGFTLLALRTRRKA